MGTKRFISKGITILNLNEHKLFAW